MLMMLIIFLITDISMVGIFAGVYGNIAKYREGMLMGVHIPKSELEHPDIKELLQLYKKRNRQFYLWNMLDLHQLPIGWQRLLMLLELMVFESGIKCRQETIC